MDWSVQFWTSVGQSLVWMIRLSVVFGVLAWFMPCNPGMYWWKSWRGSATNFFYYFFTPLIMLPTRLLVFGVGIFYLCGGEPGFAALRNLPIWSQCIAILLIQDFVLYWIHRTFHGPRGWRFHAVHHSPKTLDWPAAARMHIVNYLLSVVLVDAVVILLGFSMQAILVLGPFNTYYSAMVHANLNWTFGPLRFVFASPVFHRWHHVAAGQGVDKNFASTFPILDLLFGTFYMPKAEIPQSYGCGDDHFPESYWGQFLYPFRKKPAQQNSEAHASSVPVILAWQVTSENTAPGLDHRSGEHSDLLLVSAGAETKHPELEP